MSNGERHEAIAFKDLMQGGKVKRTGRGRPKSRPRYFLGDKAYSRKGGAPRVTPTWDYSSHSPTA